VNAEGIVSTQRKKVEGKVEVRHSREWGWKEDECVCERERERENGREKIDLPWALVPPIRVLFFLQPSLTISTLPSMEGSQLPFVAARRAEKERG